MSSFLNLDQIQPAGQIPQTGTAEQLQTAKTVKSLGITALLMTLAGAVIPILGLFLLIGALILSRYALRISRQNLVPIEYEKFAYWASIASMTILVLSTIGLFWLIMNL